MTEPRREWDIAAIAWNQVAALLDKGWEPFAVVQAESTTQSTVYLRRRIEESDD